MSELEKRLMKHIDLLVERYPSLESEKNSIISAYLLLLCKWWKAACGR